MSVLNTVYNALEADEYLNTMLAANKLRGSAPAIYETWAAENTELPYVCLSYVFTTSDHWAKRSIAVSIDVFTASDSLQAENIKDRIIEILDRSVLQDNEDREVRCYLDNDNILEEDDPQICHWHLEFEAIVWRNGFIEYLTTSQLL